MESSIPGMLDFTLNSSFSCDAVIEQIMLKESISVTALPRPLGTPQRAPLGSFKKAGKSEMYLKIGIFK